MKKLLILTLFFFSVCHAQISKDVAVYRGDSTKIEFKANGNITNKAIIFVVKLSKSFSSPRLIQKKNILAGGSASEITATYSAPQTKVTVYLGPDDTQDLEAATYYYDIIAANPAILESYYTFNYGKFTFINGGDVQTPFDGTNLPEDGTRFFVAGSFVTNANHGDLFTYDSTTHTIQPVDKDSIWQFLSVSDTVSSILRDSLSKYPIKSDDESITGEWSFNKVNIDSLTIITQDTTTIRKFNITSKSANYTLTNAYDMVLVTNGVANDTITLPITNISNGRAFRVKKIDESAGSTVVIVEGGGTIDGETSFTIDYRYYSYEFIKSGNNYYIF